MEDVQDLHQIEYRHHQTKDLSPVATSMTSRESLAGWDSRIRAWVRHPHADMLSESACYQVFGNAQAALAWRYWDERAASREDGTLGRPLVSRVLVGPVSVLTPEVALASCRAGLSAEWVGPLPGQTPDGGELPVVSGKALLALAGEMVTELDQAAATQKGLQAVVAAALAEPIVPLSISIHDALIQVPLRECVQCPLLWGLRRVAGSLLGPVGRGWSFSTFELPLGKMDPTNLPGIVFRESQEGAPPPPARWRREAKVRPFEDAALNDDTSYAGMIERAGWLIAEYRKRGGDGFEQFITECGGGGGPFAVRMGQVSQALRKAHQPQRSSGRRHFGGDDQTEVITGTRAAASGALESEPTEPGHEPGYSEPIPEGVGDPQIEVPRGDTQAPPSASATADLGGSGGPVGGDGFRQNANDVDLAVPARQAQSGGPARSPRHAYPDSGPGWQQSPADPLARSRGGQTPPPLSLPARSGPPVTTSATSGRERNPSRDSQESVSALLKRLEYLGEDQELFESILKTIYLAGVITPEERGKSWDVISNNDWYLNISENNSFRSDDIANIFTIVVIPELADRPPVEVIAKWVLKAPVALVEGLLAAAWMTDVEVGNTVMGILEPALAYRWTIENFIRDRWDEGRVVRPYADFGRSDNSRGLLGRFRRAGPKS